MYEHSVQFVPKNVSPKDAKTIRTVNFKLDSRDLEKIKKQSYKEASIDEYALRNHWEIFNCEIQFGNKPWDGFDELCGKLISFPEATDWKLVDNILYIVVSEENKKQDYIRKVKSYYKNLNPKEYKSDIISVIVEPQHI